MTITKEQVLDLVNGLNKRFDSKYTALRDPNFCSYKIIVATQTKFNEFVLEVYDSGMITAGSFHDIDAISYATSWHSTLLKEAQLKEDEEFSAKSTPWDYLPDYMKQESLDAMNGNEKVNANDSLLNVADKLNDLLDTKYGKNHAVEIANTLVNINNSLKD